MDFHNTRLYQRLTRFENMSLFERLKIVWETTPLHTKVMLGLVLVGFAFGLKWRGGVYLGIDF